MFNHRNGFGTAKPSAFTGGCNPGALLLLLPPLLLRFGALRRLFFFSRVCWLGQQTAYSLRLLQLLRPGVRETLAQGQLVGQAGQVGVGGAPLDLGKPERQVAQCTPHGHIGQTEMNA